MFGYTVKTRLDSAGIPYDKIEKIKSGDDIEALYIWLYLAFI